MQLSEGSEEKVGIKARADTTAEARALRESGNGTMGYTTRCRSGVGGRSLPDDMHDSAEEGAKTAAPAEPWLSRSRRRTRASARERSRGTDEVRRARSCSGCTGERTMTEAGLRGAGNKMSVSLAWSVPSKSCSRAMPGEAKIALPLASGVSALPQGRLDGLDCPATARRRASEAAITGSRPPEHLRDRLEAGQTLPRRFRRISPHRLIAGAEPNAYRGVIEGGVESRGREAMAAEQIALIA